ncbi:DUF4383 domain-containing protein [Lolliginicoccus suaedae]|uniref:DUF4383 domain-containing protein n=1 Tax=Lolliginicoccus suaedae TaxID=2605429 RepID=UPI0011EF0F55|nr:DUF4383 domain-containing protein [Lolliginicoccus suaedae]
MSINRVFAYISAAIYLAAGVVGFLITGFDDFAGQTDEKILFLAVNPLHNLVHIALGLAWLAAAQVPAVTRTANMLLGAGLLGAFVLGVAGAAEFLNITSVTEPDNALHLVYGIASIVIGWRADRRSAVTA